MVVKQIDLSDPEKVQEQYKAEKMLLEEMVEEMQPYLDALEEQRARVKQFGALYTESLGLQRRSQRAVVASNVKKAGCPNLRDMIINGAEGKFKDYNWYSSTGIEMGGFNFTFRTVPPVATWEELREWCDLNRDKYPISGSSSGVHGLSVSFTCYSFEDVRVVMNDFGLDIPKVIIGYYYRGPKRAWSSYREYNRRQVRVDRVFGCKDELEN